MQTNIISKASNIRGEKYNRLIRSLRLNWDMYLLMLIVLVYFGIFYYAPMYGAQIAFRDYSVVKGITGSEWVGLSHFKRFFSGSNSYNLISNTIRISLYTLVAGFPFPIILALALNEIGSKFVKKSVQLITYAPYFLSTVVMVGILISFLSLKGGLINQFIEAFGLEKVNFLSEPRLFKAIYVISGIWQHTGWNSIIYLAALSAVDITLYEAATIDGANRWQRMYHITIPSIMSTVIIMLILNAGSIMNVGFEKIFLMQNTINMTESDVISTYVYRSGLINADFSFAAAVGLFNSVANFILVILVNWIARKVSDTSLF